MDQDSPNQGSPHQKPERNLIEFRGELCLITTDQELAQIDFSAITAFGFDTETKPAFKKGDNFKTALLQLATDSVAYLIRLHYIKDFQSLREVFENPNVLKAGAAIAHDIKQLQRIFPFEARGFVDIQTIAKAKGIKHLGLKSMTEEILNAFLSKGPKMTNWERQTLTEDQLYYAATDAWISLQLHRKLTELKP